jgi:hypothetical protein
VSFELEYDEPASMIRGSGCDNVGSFIIVGLFDEQIIRFVKSYSNASQRQQWVYVGQRCDAQNLMVFTGGWGTEGKQYGTFVLAASFVSLTGQWRGNYYYQKTPTRVDAPMDIDLKTEAERVHGSGRDQWGPFTIEGTVEGQQFNAMKVYENGTRWRWGGIVAARSAKISGSWGGTRYGGTFQITKQQTGEAAPALAAEAALSLLPAQEELWGGAGEHVTAKVGEGLGSGLLQTLLIGFTTFMS